jgi:outer membrane protein TolC
MRSLSLVALLALSAQAAVSQQTPVVGRTTTLTLEEAISIAQRNNPALHQVQNNVRTQDAQVRTAYGQLLPTAGAKSSQHIQPGRHAVRERRRAAWWKRRLLPVGLQSSVSITT